jgi:hypothetical protein
LLWLLAAKKKKQLLLLLLRLRLLRLRLLTLLLLPLRLRLLRLLTLLLLPLRLLRLRLPTLLLRLLLLAHPHRSNQRLRNKNRPSGRFFFTCISVIAGRMAMSASAHRDPVEAVVLTCDHDFDRILADCALQ